MLSRWRGWFRAKPALAAIVVTAITLGLAGGVVVATTSLGCGPANRLGLTLTRCNPPLRMADTRRELNFPTPSPHQPVFNPPPNANPNPNPAPNPNPNPASNPNPNPASNPNPPGGYPPATTGASAFPPQDPFYPPASNGSPPPRTLSCRLPIFAGPPGSGGFIVLPDGSFVADPRSAVALPSPAPGGPSPAPYYPPGYGGYGPGPSPAYYGMSYDATHSRWLPVWTMWVAPDGNHYAYPSTNSIYLVDASTGTQVELGAGHPWAILKVMNDRVYATIPNAAGFWVVPFSGTPKQVTTSGYWQAASGSAAFGMQTSAVPQGVATKLIKLDISSGSISDWFTRDGSNSTVIGFDLVGDPIIQGSFDNGWVIWLTKTPTSVTVIANSFENFWIQGPPVADSHGIWFPAYFQGYGNTQGFVLYIPGSGTYWLASIGGQLAGGCS